MNIKLSKAHLDRLFANHEVNRDEAIFALALAWQEGMMPDDLEFSDTHSVPGALDGFVGEAQDALVEIAGNLDEMYE